MKPVSLASMTYEEGLHLLQMRKEALDSGEAKRLPAEVLGNSFFLRDAGNEMLQEKQAAPAWLQNLGKTWNKQPLAMKSTLIGGGLGALGGLGKTVMDDEDDSYFNNMLTGGLAGTALGGGLGLAMDSKTRENIANRLSTMGEDAMNPSRVEARKGNVQLDGKPPSATERAAGTMGVNPATGLSVRPVAEQEAEAYSANEAAKGAIPNIDSKYNTATNLAVTGAEATPAAGGALYMAKNPAEQKDPAAQAMKNKGALKTETMAQRFADAEDEQYRKFLDESKRLEEEYKKQIANREELFPDGKKPKGGKARGSYGTPTTGIVRKDIELSQPEIRRRYADAVESFVGEKDINKIMANATPEDLAAFQRLEGMSQREMDKFFKKMNKSPGLFTGESAIKNLDTIVREGAGGKGAEELGKRTRQFAPMAALQEAAAAPGIGGKVYQLGRSLKRVPTGRMALLAGLGYGGMKGSELLGFRDLANKSVAEQAKRIEYRNAIENILSKTYDKQKSDAFRAQVEAAKNYAAEQAAKLNEIGQGGNQ